MHRVSVGNGREDSGKVVDSRWFYTVQTIPESGQLLPWKTCLDIPEDGGEGESSQRAESLGRKMATWVTVYQAMAIENAFVRGSGTWEGYLKKKVEKLVMKTFGKEVRR